MASQDWLSLEQLLVPLGQLDIVTKADTDWWQPVYSTKKGLQREMMSEFGFQDQHLTPPCKSHKLVLLFMSHCFWSCSAGPPPLSGPYLQSPLVIPLGKRVAVHLWSQYLSLSAGSFPSNFSFISPSKASSHSLFRPILGGSILNNFFSSSPYCGVLAWKTGSKTGTLTVKALHSDITYTNIL